MIHYFEGFACGLIPAFLVAVFLFLRNSFSVVEGF